MAVALKTILLSALLVGVGCGGASKGARCTKDSDCARGLHCYSHAGGVTPAPGERAKTHRRCDTKKRYYPSMPPDRTEVEPAVSETKPHGASIVCELEDGVTGRPLATEVRVRLLSEDGTLIDEQTSNDGACNFEVAAGTYSVAVAFSAFDIEIHFRRVFACAGKSTPVWMAIDLEASRGDKKTTDFDTPCGG